MYLDDVGSIIRKHLPTDRLPVGDVDALFRSYALLLHAKGLRVNNADVHDAWAAWMADQNPAHQSLQRYEDLDKKIQAEDEIFANAIRLAVVELKLFDRASADFEQSLFPLGAPVAGTVSAVIIDLYKMMVASSESLVTRRQAVNTFFITINGALLTAYGFVAQNVGIYRFSGAVLIAIACVGIVISLAWANLITSFGQLNTGKFKVINTIEKYLPVSVYAAEWEALGRGEDPKIYRSFTSREIWVPRSLFIIHLLAATGATIIFATHLTVQKPSITRGNATSARTVNTSSQNTKQMIPSPSKPAYQPAKTLTTAPTNRLKD